jgi:uncharacterized protein involved in exopolysaccharide biosynthesis
MAMTKRSTHGMQGFERTARLWMSGVAIMAAFIGLSFKTGLISTTPVYERQSWYLVSERSGYVVTSEVDDEAACRRRERADAVCRSGSSLADNRTAAPAR